MFWIGRLRIELAQSSLGEQFQGFSKNALSWFNRIFFLLDARNSCIFQIFLLRSIKAYLCPNIINFDGVDFSERRPEEVMFLLTLSVCYLQPFSHTRRVGLNVGCRTSLVGRDYKYAHHTNPYTIYSGNSI